MTFNNSANASNTDFKNTSGTLELASGAKNFPGQGIQISGIWNFTSNCKTAAATLTNQRLYMIPFYHTAPITLTGIAINAVTAVAGSFVRMALYTMDKTTGLFTKVTDYGTASTAAIGIVSVAATDTLDVNEINCIAISHDRNGGAPQVTTTSSTGLTPFYYSTPTQYFHTYIAAQDPASPFSATYTWASMTGGNSTMPLILYQ